MSCIHYKFSNTVENDKIKFDGLHISVADLREAITKQKSLKSNLYTLKIVDSQTKKGSPLFPPLLGVRWFRFLFRPTP